MSIELLVHNSEPKVPGMVDVVPVIHRYKLKADGVYHPLIFPCFIAELNRMVQKNNFLILL